MTTLRKFAAVFAIAAVAFVTVRTCGSTTVQGDAKDPRQILGRLWFDQYPANRRDDIQFFIFLGGGIGLYEKGSAYRWADDIFEFERQRDVVTMTFLHDKKTARVKFEITKCDDKPPFDLCLTFDDSPRGPKRYYTFADEDDMAARLPWSRAALRAAEARSKVEK